MSKLKFANTKWDARTWTQEQKVKWQEKVFSLGYTFRGRSEPIYLSSGFFFLESVPFITHTNDLKIFQEAEELALNLKDILPEEVGTQELEVETKQSIFTHPRWVTSLTFSEHEVMGITEGKDYKVIDVVYKGEDLYQYIICNDEGVADTYHLSHFHKVTPEECTYLHPVAPENEEKCEDFGSIAYHQPVILHLKYWYILLKDLSQEQVTYIGNYFCTDRRWSFGGTEDILMYQVGDYDGEYVWTNTFEHCDSKRMHKVSFNDIFKEVN